MIGFVETMGLVIRSFLKALPLAAVVSAMLFTNVYAESDPNKSWHYNSAMLIYTIAFIFTISILYIICKYPRQNVKPDIKPDVKKDYTWIFVSILALGFFTRIITAPVIEGWPGDIAINKHWAKTAAGSVFNFYNATWCDYPPLFIYVLIVVGKLSNISWLGIDFTTLIKIPSILADLVSAVIIHELVSNGIQVVNGKKTHYPGLGKIPGLVACFIYLMHPVVIIDSTIWGQVDSFFTMIILAELVFLANKRIVLSSVFFAFSVLMKPQGIFFMPILLYELIKLKKVSNFAKAFVTGLVTTIVVILPFAVNMEPSWIFKLYMGTATQYPAAVMNSFNLFAMADANFVDASKTPIVFSYTVWGFVFSFILLVIAAILHIKCKNVFTPFLSGVLLNAGAFIFSTKMHERYMFPVVALSLVAALLFRDRRLLVIFAGFSLTNFANIHILLARMLGWMDSKAYFLGAEIYPTVVLFTILNFILFAYLVYVFARIAFRDEIVDSGLSGMGFQGTGLPGAGLSGNELQGTGLPDTGVQGTGIPGKGLPGTELTGARLPNTELPGTGLPGTGLPGTGLPGAGSPVSGRHQNKNKTAGIILAISYSLVTIIGVLLSFLLKTQNHEIKFIFTLAVLVVISAVTFIAYRYSIPFRRQADENKVL